MSELHLPLLSLSVLIPLVGAVGLALIRDAYQARKWAVVLTALTLACGVAAWRDFAFLNTALATDGWTLPDGLAGELVIDTISAPLIPLVALLYFLTTLSTQRTKIRRFSFAGTLASEAILIATLCCRDPWPIVVLLAAGTLPPWWELRRRGKPTRVYVLHMALFILLLVAGQAAIALEGPVDRHALWAIVFLLLAVLVRSGMVPFHCWMTDLFEHATFGTALLSVLPITGAYAAVRLVLPIAPDGILRSIGLVSLSTAVYAAGMALVQREARRFFCYLFLSLSAPVLVGLESVNAIGLTGALCVWISIALSLGGLGLTLRGLEARFQRLSLTDFHGLYEHTPMLAVCFALTGLAAVGFPGTLGFVGTEMLIDGAVETYPHVGVALIVAAMLNGIAIVRAYFKLFTGARHTSFVSVQIRVRERVAVLALAALLLGGGLWAQPWVASRNRAAEGILLTRRTTLPVEPATPATVARHEQTEQGTRRVPLLAEPGLGSTSH